MKKLNFLFYIIIVCSSFTPYRHPDEKKIFLAVTQTPQQTDYDSIMLDCPEGCAAPLLHGKVPRKPGCICIPEYIQKVGNSYIIFYKPVIGRGDRVSVPLEVTQISPRLVNMLKTSKDNKIFVDGNKARTKSRVLQLKTL